MIGRRYRHAKPAGHRTRRVWPALTLGVLMWLLNGCEAPATLDYTPYPAATQIRLLPTLQYWQTEGKISFQSGGERQSATFDWQQYQNNYSIHIFGAFGYGSTWLKRNDNQVTLDSAKFGSHSAASAEDLMLQLVGWQVPLSDMQHWIKGAAAPGSQAKVQYNALGLPAALEQQGWQVSFERYQLVRRWQLPHKITASRGDLKLVAAIKHWDIQNSSVWD